MVDANLKQMTQCNRETIFVKFSFITYFYEHFFHQLQNISLNECNVFFLNSDSKLSNGIITN